jgi:hypothetical protein
VEKKYPELLSELLSNPKHILKPSDSSFSVIVWDHQRARRQRILPLLAGEPFFYPGGRVLSLQQRRLGRSRSAPRTRRPRSRSCPQLETKGIQDRLLRGRRSCMAFRFTMPSLVGRFFKTARQRKYGFRGGA